MTISDVTVASQGDAKLYRFVSIGELSAFVKENRARMGYMRPEAKDTQRDFYNASPDETTQRLETGNPALVAASDKLLSIMEERVTPASGAFRSVPMVAGGVVNVPAYLAGHPANMRLRRRVEDQYGPIAIVIDVTVSAGVDHKTIARRGAAALALVRALQGSRPVSLLVSMGLQMDDVNMVSVMDVDTAPLDLARAAWCLGAPEYLRRLGFGLASHACGNEKSEDKYIPWAFSDHTWQTKHLPGWIADREGFGDFVAVPGIVHGTTFKTDENAAAWVVKQVHDLTRPRD
jgi:hypothetical protein